MDRNQPFLPEGYEVPKEGGNFLNKFPEGDTTLRLLSPVKFGYRYWNLDGRPVYSEEDWQEYPIDIRPNDDGSDQTIQHVWIVAAWHYEAEAVVIVQMHQTGIQDLIRGLFENPKWGEPKNYDIVINRKGTAIKDTKYTVQPQPKEAVTQDVLQALAQVSIDLDAAFVEDGHVMSHQQLGAGEQPAPEPEVVDPVKDNGAPTEEETDDEVIKTESGEEIRLEDIPF